MTHKSFLNIVYFTLNILGTISTFESLIDDELSVKGKKQKKTTTTTTRATTRATTTTAQLLRRNRRSARGGVGGVGGGSARSSGSARGGGRSKTPTRTASSLRYTSTSSPITTLSTEEIPLTMSSMSFPSFVQAIFFLGFNGHQMRFANGMPDLAEMTVESDIAGYLVLKQTIKHMAQQSKAILSIRSNQTRAEQSSRRTIE